MPENLLGGQGATLLTAIIIVAVALLALVGVFWLIRKRASSTFIRGGKNRQPRLAVLDATAVDTRRRLVLIRRDDVEHLVMIGGPTDIVIESRIPQQPDQGRAAQQADHATPSPTPPQQQRMAPPAPRSAPQQERASAPAQSTAPSIDRLPRQVEAAAQPSVRQQPPLFAPTAAVASVAVATASRTEAADLLETARTRVFEEPDFDESTLDDLMAVPQRAVQNAPSASAPKPAPLQPAAPSTRAPAASAAADPIQAKAADVLENVRTRVFEEPSFDESAFDELTAAPARSEQASPAAATTRPPAATSEPAPPAPSDFEAVLAAELSEDPTLGAPQSNFIAAQYNEHQLDPGEAELLEAPDVNPEPQPSRDSLEAEMERLLGDLSRKP